MKEKGSHAKNKFPKTNEALHGEFMSMGTGIWLHGCMELDLYKIFNRMHMCNGPRGHVSKLVSFLSKKVDLLILYICANHQSSYL